MKPGVEERNAVACLCGQLLHCNWLSVWVVDVEKSHGIVKALYFCICVRLSISRVGQRGGWPSGQADLVWVQMSVHVAEFDGVCEVSVFVRGSSAHVHLCGCVLDVR